MNDTITRLIPILAEALMLQDPKPEEILDQSLQDLGSDSLDAIDLILAVEEEFGVDIDDDDYLPPAITVRELAAKIETSLQAKAS